MNPKVELLTAAKRYLWDGITPSRMDRYGHICGALAEALRSDYYLADDYKQAYGSLTERIDAHIAPHNYFSAWLKEKEADPDIPRHVIQAKRLEYVEQLIEEFSNESTPSPAES